MGSFVFSVVKVEYGGFFGFPVAKVEDREVFSYSKPEDRRTQSIFE